jgi:hypothetical protein
MRSSLGCALVTIGALLVMGCATAPGPTDSNKSGVDGRPNKGGGMTASGGTAASRSATGSGGMTASSGATTASTGGTGASAGGMTATGGTTASTGGTTASTRAMTSSYGSPTAGAAGTTASSGTTAGSGAVTAGTGGMTGAAGRPGIRPISCAPADAPNLCGNGQTDPGEDCDGSDLRGLTSCTEIDAFFTGGTFSCTSSCELDLSHCVHGTCGNGVIDPGEDCDINLESTQVPCSALVQGEQGSIVGCSLSTCRYDLANCSNVPPSVCGNGKVEAGESCDGDDRTVRSCQESAWHYKGGHLGCNQATCQLDFTQCTRCDGSSCGDGVISNGEQCDGATLGGATCMDNGRLFGEVHCNAVCNVDYSDCRGGCTIYKGMIVNCN